jgi:two-component system CheB/CheR fusion protein
VNGLKYGEMSGGNSSPEPDDPGSPETPEADGFFVVGIGASAGGLEAFSSILSRLPADAPLAFILLQHLDPVQPSSLAELLREKTRIPLQWIVDGAAIQPRTVYVLPPGHALQLRAGVLRLEPRKTQGRSTLIDDFFRSLADSCKHRAIGVVLSGGGSDGSLGLKLIKAAGGITFAQEEATAGHRSMPEAAGHSGFADRILPPADIADELVRLALRADRVWHITGDNSDPKEDADFLTAIYRLLTSRTGVDFSHYKQTTIKRRVIRRMVLTKAESLGEYLHLLQKDRQEVQALYETLLINVTEFFRDTDCFEFIREKILPAIIDQHRDRSPIRAWITGCSTGEEVYSFSILLRELLDDQGLAIPVQIFGTDISDRAIAVARAGFYSAADVAGVSPERLQRFFLKTDRGYTVSKGIRDMCIFARQNVVRDSPFSRLDLISCRNLLIYLDHSLQRKLMPLFFYALRPDGHLVLGNSESVGIHADLFRLVDRRFRVYSRKSATRRLLFDFPIERSAPDLPTDFQPHRPMLSESKEPMDVLREADRIVLSRHAPPGVLVNEDLDILQFRGNVTPFLAPMPGRASLSLLKMAREGLASALQSVILEAKTKHERVRRAGITMMDGGEPRQVELDVTPVNPAQQKESFYLILFTQAEPAPPPSAASVKTKGVKNAPTSEPPGVVEQLKQDLQTARSYLQTTIEKHEATNQELRAANEVIQSSNEELQSTNEELETAKEELQSTNEELTTVNEELHSRQLELVQLNNDLNNLINSVHLPIIILSQDMRIRRFTPMAEKTLNIIPTDIGRPLSDLNLNLSITDLPRLMGEVTDSLTVRELEVQDQQGRWYSLRLRPYKTTENKIEGVVMTLIDIDQMKRAMAELDEARQFANSIIETIKEPLIVLDSDFQVKVANGAYYRLFGTIREQTEKRPFFELGNNQWNEPRLHQLLAQVLPGAEQLADFPVEANLPGGRQALILRARQILSAGRAYPLILISFLSPASD